MGGIKASQPMLSTNMGSLPAILKFIKIIQIKYEEQA
jgi:hypothetical protein